MRWDGALRSVGIQLRILAFKEHGEQKLEEDPSGGPVGGLGERGVGPARGFQNGIRKGYLKCRD